MGIGREQCVVETQDCLLPQYVYGSGERNMTMDIQALQQFDLFQTEKRPTYQRPHTAGSTTPNFSKRRTKGERETRDDLAYSPFPPTRHSRSAAPRPTVTPLKLPSTQSQKCTYTSASSTDASSGEFGEPTCIGMALGSPTHMPTDFEKAAKLRSTSNHLQPSPIPLSTKPQRRHSRWLTLGGLFGGKRYAQPKPQLFYQVQVQPDHHDWPGLPLPTTRTVTETPVDPQPDIHENTAKARIKQRKQQPNTTQSAPKKIQRRYSLKRDRSRVEHDLDKKGGPAASEYSPQVSKEEHWKREEDATSGSDLPLISPTAPQLEIGIPSIKMERYSIMFSDVLKENPGALNSAVLTRRQPTSEKLGTLNEVDQEGEQQEEKKVSIRLESNRSPRAPSPEILESPILSTFPISQRSLQPPKHIQRPNTRLAETSPFETAFAPNSERKIPSALALTNSRKLSVARSDHRVDTPTKLSRETYADARMTPEQFQAGSSQLIFDSGDSDEEETIRKQLRWTKRSMTTTAKTPSHAVPNALVPPTSSSEMCSPSTWSNAPWISAPISRVSSVSTIQASTPNPKSSHSYNQSPASTSATVQPTKFTSPRTRSAPISSAFRIPSSTSSQMGNVSTRGANPSHPNLSSSTVKPATSSPFNATTVTTICTTTPKEKTEQRLKGAAAQSIARQISVSHQQNNLLSPLSGSGSGSGSAMSTQRSASRTNLPRPLHIEKSAGARSGPLSQGKERVREWTKAVGTSKQMTGKELQWAVMNWGPKRSENESARVESTLSAACSPKSWAESGESANSSPGLSAVDLDVSTDEKQ